MARRLSHVIGFDDAPFDRNHRGDVAVIGAVYAGARLEGVLAGRVRRDGANATRVLAALVARSRFRAHLQAVLLQGIAFAGFNVVDLPGLHRVLGIPVLAVCRRQPDFAAIRRALLARVPGGRRKWRLIEQLGPMEPAAGLYVQRVGLAHERAAELLARLAIHGRLPEPLRTAHLIAGGLAGGTSRQRA
jgi:endonuclease V-like protein UPF0215 family